ncbi:MAG: ParB/RepB/Spo0J family partition protein [Chloroflexi bacterium]|nr:ParB/RepB/Spo0J family partition protein [Chloroflexota bacterium]
MGKDNGHAPRVELVEVTQISNAGNIRTDLGDLHALAETFENGEPTQPPVVVETGDGGYELVVGQRRLAAAVLLGKAQLHVLVQPRRPANPRLTQARENLARKALNPLEEARLYEELLHAPEIGGHQGRLSEALGISQATVSRRLALLSLAEPVLELVADGTLPASHAEEIAGAGLEQADQVRIANDLRGRSKVTIAAVQYAVRQRQGDRAPTRQSEARQRQAVAATERTPPAAATAKAPPADATEKRESPYDQRFYEAGDTPEHVRAYQVIREIQAQVLEVSQSALVRPQSMSRELRRSIRQCAANAIAELKLIEEATR